MEKRNKLDILKDILSLVSTHKSILPTPLLRKSNLSSKRFKLYYNELIEKKFLKEIPGKRNKKKILLTEKGFAYLEKYKTIVHFIDEFDL